MVPDESERCTAWIGWAGSEASGFSAAMAGSSQLVIWPLKMRASVSPDRTSSSTPSRL